MEGTVVNSGTLEALAAGHIAVGGTVANSSAGLILASGSGAGAELDGATISRGTVEEAAA